MANEYKLSYTAQEIDEKLSKVTDVDIEYDPASSNPQSGFAVRDAVREVRDDLDVTKEYIYNNYLTTSETVELLTDSEAPIYDRLADIETSILQKEGEVEEAVQNANNYTDIAISNEPIRKHRMFATCYKYDDNLPASSKWYYVDNIEGDDTNSGHSWDKPFETLQKALDTANAEGNHDTRILLVESDIPYDYPYASCAIDCLHITGYSRDHVAFAKQCTADCEPPVTLHFSNSERAIAFYCGHINFQGLTITKAEVFNEGHKTKIYSDGGMVSFGSCKVLTKYQQNGGFTWIDGCYFSCLSCHDALVSFNNLSTTFMGDPNDIPPDWEEMYSLLDSEPEDWNILYKDYYTADTDGKNYTLIKSSTAPPFKKDTYYRLDYLAVDTSDWARLGIFGGQCTVRKPWIFEQGYNAYMKFQHAHVSYQPEEITCPPRLLSDEFESEPQDYYTLLSDNSMLWFKAATWGTIENKYITDTLWIGGNTRIANGVTTKMNTDGTLVTEKAMTGE